MFLDRGTHLASFEIRAHICNTPVRKNKEPDTQTNTGSAFARLDKRLAPSRRSEALGSPPSGLVGPGHALVLAASALLVAAVADR